MHTTSFAKSLSTRLQTSGDGATSVALALALIVISDALFYGHPVGISLSAFLVLLAVAAVPANRLRAIRREWVLAGANLVFSLLPAVETIGPLSMFFGFAGAAAFALVVTGNARAAWPVLLRRIAVLLTADLCRIGRRYTRWRRSHRAGALAGVVAAAATWLVPLALGMVFVVLFSLANPVFWSWVSLLDLWSLLAALEPLRLLFWLLVGAFVTTFIRVPAFARPGGRGGDIEILPQGWRMGTGLIIRSLIVFNAIFALQTVLDAIYLWGGAELPEGVSPAANAQKAAYLLVVSALLAAAFVLAAVRDTDDTHSQRLVRWLVYLWIAQNVVLVLSAILRLDLYIEVYSLTRLRLAAFVWMGLVVAGLVLIVLRIVTSKSNGWLIKANLVVLGIMLYGCSVIDLNAVIASYNVGHSREISGQGVALDRRYLCELGPSALPAIDTFMDMRAAARRGNLSEPILSDCAVDLRNALMHRSRDWRAWTLREHRLRLYLAKHSEARGGRGDAIEDTDRR
ncbi:DUF4153 domain-containing protein [Chelativorans salis]|uniref:DUF4173 domain-containing protein n=1 Tax=Chelativorans salis TaxID=2978478 RepID=A0ABT2LTL3_9HYPH|nr:DUF4173 domain-containing protein [Chelativorans sp. EGI FJ00035]MCT7377399.1 DUF4173 domain-containing protein [Chelativorans sp. EGI FJ00035]